MLHNSRNHPTSSAASCQLQGQDLPGALWSIGQRSPGADIADVRALASTATRRREKGLTDAIIEAAAEVAANAHQDHALLRAELLERFEAAGPQTDQGRGVAIT